MGGRGICRQESDPRRRAPGLLQNQRPKRRLERLCDGRRRARSSGFESLPRGIIADRGGASAGAGAWDGTRLSQRGISLETYATLKHLPLEFLRSLGLETVQNPYRPSQQAVSIPYRRPDGSLLRLRYRVAGQGKPKLIWDKAQGQTACRFTGSIASRTAAILSSCRRRERLSYALVSRTSCAWRARRRHLPAGPRRCLLGGPTHDRPCRA